MEPHDARIYRIATEGRAPLENLDPAVCPLRFEGPDGTFFLGEPDLRVATELGIPFRIVETIDPARLPVRFFLPHEGAVNNPPPEGARLAVLARLLSEGRATGELHVRFVGRNRTVPPDGFALDQIDGRRRYVWQLVPADEQRSELREKYTELLRLFADEDTRVALSLGSGGLKLFAHATAIRLLEGIGCADDIDEIWGTSGGAIAGLLYSHGLSPQAIEQTGYDLYAGRYTLTIRPSRLQVVRNLVREAFLQPSQMSHAGFVDCADGLARMIDRYCAAVKARLPLYCLAFSLADCRPHVLTAEPIPDHLRDLCVKAEPRDAALASAAVPLLFIPRSIAVGSRDVPYVDGSTTEDVPLRSVVRKFDLDRAAGVETRRRLVILYVKLTPSLGQYRTRTGRMGKIRLLQTIAAAAIDTMHCRDVELIRARRDVELIALQLPETSPDFFDLTKIPDTLRSAKESFPLQLAEIEERLRAR